MGGDRVREHEGERKRIEMIERRVKTIERLYGVGSYHGNEPNNV